MKHRIKIVSSAHNRKTTYIPQYKFIIWWNYYQECFDGVDVYYEIYKSNIKQEIEDFIKLESIKPKQSIKYETVNN